MADEIVYSNYCKCRLITDSMCCRFAVCHTLTGGTQHLSVEAGIFLGIVRSSQLPESSGEGGIFIVSSDMTCAALPCAC